MDEKSTNLQQAIKPTTRIILTVGFIILVPFNALHYYVQKSSIEDNSRIIAKTISTQLSSQKEFLSPKNIDQALDTSNQFNAANIVIFDNNRDVLSVSKNLSLDDIHHFDQYGTVFKLGIAHQLIPLQTPNNKGSGSLYLRYEDRDFVKSCAIFFIMTLLSVIAISLIVTVILSKFVNSYTKPLKEFSRILSVTIQRRNYLKKPELNAGKGIRGIESSFHQLFDIIVENDKEREVAQQQLKESNNKLKALVEELQHSNNFDSLTKLPNKTLLLKRLQNAIYRSEKHHKKIAVISLNLDGFREINDSLGHKVGDYLLVKVAERLLYGKRQDDTVARLNGDKFIYILEDVQNKVAIHHHVKKVMKSFKQPFELQKLAIDLNITVGVSVYPDNGNNTGELLKNAETAMYRAKAAGRNHNLFYHADMNAFSLRRLTIANELRSALASQQMHLVYQPQLNLFTNEIIGAEALLRWQHPKYGMISPVEFIPIAESTGTIVEIGYWVIRQCIKQANIWHENGLTGIHKSINLSAIHFLNGNVDQQIEKLIVDCQFPIEQLVFEVTETVMMKDIDQSVSVLNKIKGLGAKIAMDDFGIGYSSLNYIKKLPIDHLKIDRSFITDIHTNDADQALVRAVITLAKSLDLTVVAEGVEKESQRQMLKKLRCHIMQGNLLSNGISAEQFYALTKHVNKQAKLSPPLHDLSNETLEQAVYIKKENQDMHVAEAEVN